MISSGFPAATATAARVRIFFLPRQFRRRLIETARRRNHPQADAFGLALAAFLPRA